MDYRIKSQQLNISHKIKAREVKTKEKSKNLAKERILIISVALFTLYIFVFLLTEFTVNIKCGEILGPEKVVSIYSIGIICTSLGYISFFLTQRIVRNENKRRILIVMLTILFMASTVGFLSVGKSIAFVALSLIALLLFGYIGGFAHYTISLFLFNMTCSGKVIGLSIALATLMQFAVQNLPIREKILEISILLSIIAIIYLALKPIKDWMFENPLPYAEKPVITSKQLWIPAVTVALMSLCFGLGDGLVTWLHASGAVNISSFTRLMYALGIIVAGIIADVKNRKYLPLSVLCMLVLASAMALFLEEGNTASNNAYIVVMYLFAGFYVMYLTITFVDVAPMTGDAAMWAGMGRVIRGPFIALTAMLSGPMFARLGPNGIAVSGICLAIITLILLVISGGLMPHQQAFPTRQSKNNMEEFVKECNLTPRESEIMVLLLDGDTTNKDIAGDLCISLRVLERYISSIYEKAEVQSRIELVNKFYRSNIGDTEVKSQPKLKRQSINKQTLQTMSEDSGKSSKTINVDKEKKAGQAKAENTLKKAKNAKDSEGKSAGESTAITGLAAKYNLTNREKELLTLVGKKMTNEEIAAELGITENTVKFHLKNLMKKMSAKNRKELRDILSRK